MGMTPVPALGHAHPFILCVSFVIDFSCSQLSGQHCLEGALRSGVSCERDDRRLE
jgi:hypothetical protein